jgi:3-oxoacyl-[acyl-carrier protein] reductase
MGFELNDKIALVTGASRGIGRAIALELAAAGCDLLLTARDQAALDDVAQAVRALGRRAEIHVADLREAEAPKALAGAAEQRFGRLDILVNNAGASRRGDFFEQTDADWESGFALKFFAQVRLCRAAWPMLKATGGSVVAIGGIGARAPVADYMIGSSVIGAQSAFMKALADIGKRDGVQVNMVHPGSVDTDRFRGRLGILMQRTGLAEDAAIEAYRKELNITRLGKPDDIAGLVAFIVSARGRWLHGTAIDMDGGQVEPLRMTRYD